MRRWEDFQLKKNTLENPDTIKEPTIAEPTIIVETPPTDEPSPSEELPHVMEPPPKIPKTEERPSFIVEPIVESPLNMEHKIQREADPPSSSYFLSSQRRGFEPQKI